jgi:hypothetical protein
MQAQQQLASACGMASAVELAALHACDLIMGMLPHSTGWTADHPDVRGFLTILRNCPGETLAAVGEQLCKALGAITRDHDRDADLRISLLNTLDHVIEDDARGPAICRRFGVALCMFVLLPPLVWRAGAPQALYTSSLSSQFTQSAWSGSGKANLSVCESCCMLASCRSRVARCPVSGAQVYGGTSIRVQASQLQLCASQP